MQAKVKWVDRLTFLGESASGHHIVMDGNSGEKAPGPMEMVLMAAGGCSSVDIVSFLQQHHHAVTGCEVLLTTQRREQAPRFFTELHLHFIVTGQNLSESAVAQAVTLSAEKYCSVTLMLQQTVKVSHSWEVITT